MQSQFEHMILEAREAISHHDPAIGSGSNVLTFNRNKQFIYRIPDDTPVMQHLIDQLGEENQMPETIQDLVSRLTLSEWLTVAYVRVLLDAHNGQGLLEGMGRYRMLENRLQTAAARCHTLHQLWSILTHDLQLNMHASYYDEKITLLFTLPPSVQYQMLALMVEQYRAVTTLARVWHTVNKAQNEDYCIAAGIPFVPQAWFTPHFDVSSFPNAQKHIILDVPAISVNSLRHQLVREPAWLHLCHHLGIQPWARGAGPLAPGTEALFYNGGNIKAGVMQPANAFALAGEIRAAYPSLDLLGGVTNSFDIGESKLKMSAWIICLENRDALPDAVTTLPQSRISVFDMLDDVTRTRMATDQGAGQMIYNYETLIKGTQIYVEFTLTPYTIDMTKGALITALDYYLANDNIVGGQSTRGHGHVKAVRLPQFKNAEECKALYEHYLADNRERLLDGLLTGVLCTSSKTPVAR